MRREVHVNLYVHEHLSAVISCSFYALRKENDILFVDIHALLRVHLYSRRASETLVCRFIYLKGDKKTVFILSFQFLLVWSSNFQKLPFPYFNF